MFDYFLKRNLVNAGIYEPILSLKYYFANKRLKSIHERAVKTGEMPMPSIFNIELTMRCNLKCPMCVYKDLKIPQKSELSTHEFISLIEDKLSSYIKRIGLTGAEIFMKKDIFHLLDYLQEKEIKISLLTNGTLLNNQRMSRLLTYRNISQIVISIDGLESLHNQIRGKGSFKKALTVLEGLSGKYNLGITTVIMKPNLNEITKLLKLGRKYKATMGLQFEIVYTHEGLQESKKILGFDDGFEFMPLCDSKQYDYLYEQLEQSIKDFKKEAQRIRVPYTLTPFVPGKYLKSLYDGTLRENAKLTCSELSTCRIDTKGNVIPCFAIKKSFGNLVTHSFEEIWNSKDYRNFRINLLSNNLTPICERCCRVRVISPDV